jgi:hypothetical protein
MEEEVTPSEEGEVCPVSPVYRVGDTIVFKYEGNVRASVEGHEIVGGKLRYRCRADVSFLVPASQVVGVESEGEG